MPRNRIRQLQEIEEAIRSCQLCPLAVGRTNAVPGEGSYNARLMIVGEAPGRQEDAQARPFVGSAGKFLRSTLESQGISVSTVYITNIVRCRPPGNRKPASNEWETCTDNYLWVQIRLINPDVICLLGNTAVEAVLGIKSVKVVRGKVTEKEGRLYFVTYHPAAALYDVKLKDVIVNDIRRLKEVLENPNRFRKRKREAPLESFMSQEAS